MSHNIFFNEQTGKHSFFSVNEKAWHNLGQVVTEYPTSTEAIIHAGLNYEVEKRNLITGCSNKEGGGIILPEIKVPDYFATVRKDTQSVLGVVGKDYQIVQNAEAFTFFDSIVGGGDGILYETAGALGKGERIFITAKLPSYIKVGNHDAIEKYIFLTTSHDGTGSITAAFTPVRIVCQNTLNAALRNCSNVVRIRHTASAQEKLKEAHRIMGIADILSEELNGIFNQWAKVRINDKEVLKLIQTALAPSKEVLKKVNSGEELSTTFTNMCNNAFMYAMASPTQQTETTKGTLFGAYNAVTGYFQNVKEYKTGENKLQSILFGTGLQRTQTAFRLCEAFAKDGNSVLLN